MDIIKVNENKKEIIKKIIMLEKETFGEEGAIRVWELMPFIRYGDVYILYSDTKEIIGVAEFINTFSKDKVYLYGILIKKEFQSQGLGRIFLEKLITKYKNINLTVKEDNIKAIKLYSSLGFKIIRKSTNEYGKNKDRLIMELTK